MALSKSERLEVQAAAATNVRYRMEEEKLRERQKVEKAQFIEDENKRLMDEALNRKERATSATTKKVQAKAQTTSSQTKKGK